jgi:hypothetical protein
VTAVTRDPRAEDIRNLQQRSGPKTAAGGGAAYGQGYGAGGLSAGGEPGDPIRDPWDAPGVAPDGRRTGAATDGPRVAMDGESEPFPDLPEDADLDPDAEA